MRARPLLRLAFVLAALGLGGCLQRPIGHFGEGAYYHARGHYRIRYDAGEADLLPAPWALANYTHDDAGRPLDERMGPNAELEMDTQWLSGRGRRRTFRVPRVDLVYTRPNSAIWVRTVVVPRAWQETGAASILHAWAEAATQGRAEIDPLHSRGVAEEATLAHFGEAIVDGLPAHWVELAVRNGETHRRVTWVAVRPRGHEWRWHRRHGFPMVLVFGFSSPPDEHESVRRDFEQLVARVDIHR